MMPIDPAGERGKQEMEWEDVRHDSDRTGEAQGRKSRRDSADEYSDSTCAGIKTGME
jgi:hypothetical protein